MENSLRSRIFNSSHLLVEDESEFLDRVAQFSISEDEESKEETKRYNPYAVLGVRHFVFLKNQISSIHSKIIICIYREVLSISLSLVFSYSYKMRIQKKKRPNAYDVSGVSSFFCFLE